MIQLTCKACGKRIAVNDKLAGKKGPCPRCRTRLQVPLASSVKTAHREERNQSIRLSCPQCDQAIRFKQNAAGKRGKCPGCGSLIEIPPVAKNADAGPTEEVLAVYRDAELAAKVDNPNQPLPKKAEPKPQEVLGGCFVVLLLGALVIGLLSWLGSSDPYAGMTNDEKVEEAARRGDWKTWESTPTEADREYSRELERRVREGNYEPFDSSKYQRR